MNIDVALVRALIASQFPAWAHLAAEPVVPNGWDNRTFRLGTDLSGRLPSHERYAAQVDKEHEWLPKLGPLLPVPVPIPVARGRPGAGYPWSWSVYRWLPGETADADRIDDLEAFAGELAAFLRALHRIDAEGGPPPGRHNFFRGGSLAVWDAETREAIESLDGHIDRGLATEAWERALDAEWQGEPVWVHGDLVATNLLVDDGRLGAVIDFGCSAVGDPSCDLPIAWLMFADRSRRVFRERMELDPRTWARGRGWTLWKRLVTLARDPGDRRARRVLDELLSEHEAEA